MLYMSIGAAIPELGNLLQSVVGEANFFPGACLDIPYFRYALRDFCASVQHGSFTCCNSLMEVHKTELVLAGAMLSKENATLG